MINDGNIPDKGVSGLEPLNSDGYIRPGLHSYTYGEFKQQFVVDFTTSQTRMDIYSKCLQWMNELRQVWTPVEIWLDGSFISDKLNPNDIDLVVFFDKTTLTQQAVAEWSRLQASSKSFLCDAYAGIYNNQNADSQDINSRNYWRGQFGFDRSDLPKGIIVMEWNQVVDAIQEGVAP